MVNFGVVYKKDMIQRWRKHYLDYEGKFERAIALFGLYSLDVKVELMRDLTMVSVVATPLGIKSPCVFTPCFYSNGR